MYLVDEIKLMKQRLSLPKGYDIVTSGRVQEGDIRWNCLDDCWNLNDVTLSPKHDIIIGDPVTNFHGVCRHQELIRKTAVVKECENPLHKPQFISIP